ncbi:MAG: acetylesterase [Clostridia bacterium]|nr:acetylesterase [Clostridia bacterium]
MAILTGQYYSLARKRQVPFSVILPMDAMDERGKPLYADGPFPTLYLLHGYSGNFMDWLYDSTIAREAMKRGMAVVMPSGDNSFYLNNEFTGEAYADFIGEELVSVTRKLFPLSRKREETFIGGLSMGGFGALRSGLYFNHVFGAVFALSSALITDEVAQMQPGKGNAVAPYEYYVNTFGDPKKLLQSDKAPKTLIQKRLDAGEDVPRLFLACGTEDFLYPNNVDLHEFLMKRKVPHAWVTHPGVHNFDFWNYALPIALDWLVAGMKGEAASGE